MNGYAKKIEKTLKGSLSSDFWRVRAFDSLPSTNDFLREIASTEREGSVVVACTQTSGKGRQGRKFYSPDGGIYMSVLLKPAPELVPKITALTAVAVRQAIIEVTRKTPLIKWVNDLYLEDKKVAGILAESQASDGKVDYVIVGIGVNLYPSKGGFPDEIKDLAGTVESENGDKKAHLICAILDNLYRFLSGEEFVEIYRKESYLSGKNLKISTKNGEICGKFVEIDEDCRLVIDTENGAQKFFSGEVVKVGYDEKNC